MGPNSGLETQTPIRTVAACDRCSKQNSACTLERDHVAFKRLCVDPSLRERRLSGVLERTRGNSENGAQRSQANIEHSTAPEICIASDTLLPAASGTAEDFRLSETLYPLVSEDQSSPKDAPNSDSGWQGNEPSVTGTFSPAWDDFSLFFDEQGGPGLFLDTSYAADLLHPQINATNESPEDHTQGSDISIDDRERYDNYPQLYKPDPKGNPLRTSVICEFLQSKQAWAKVDEFGQSHENNASVPIPEEARDSIMATIHIVLAKVLDKDQMGRIPTTFPPLRTVQTIFDAYLSRLAVFYPITHPGTLNQDHAMPYNGPGMQLQLLSTFVSGALMIPVPEVQTFATDLASIILQVLYEIFLRDANQTKDIYLTSTAILITAFGIWSGNKRQMELAEALRSSYTTMMSRRGLHERAQQRILEINLSSVDFEWRDWVMTETRRRLAYVWYVVEQEISLFNGVPTTLSFTEMRCPMPSNEALFAASSGNAWKDLLQLHQSELTTPTSSTVATLKCPHSLAAFHRRFLSGNIFQFQDAVTPFEVRLLLCSIQTLVSQYSQTKRFVPEEEEFYPETCTMSASTEYGQLRREELHYLLVKWHLLYRRVMPHVTPIRCGTDLSCILMAHLIAMELYVSFDDVQLFAGKEGFVEGRMLMPSFRRWAKTSGAARALLHAGQIMHTLRVVAEGTARPLWWPLAVARAALLLWAYGMAAQADEGNIDDRDCTSHPSLANSGHLSAKQYQGLDPIDGELEDSALFSGSLIGYWDKGKVPCLQVPDGSFTPLLQISETLELSISLLRNGENVSTPLCRSVRTFLQDIQGLGVTYPGLSKGGMAIQQ
ncbi:hypothetical protein Z517_00156 [Fonsecaea pedrosoi CBS 271.37]|uniref:Xylanolytic transcriptional activator regulatory domain-containing protein n=1 Tax=Fonsecaea pedrosoi CBS 271.37 TaxID=1442368 RepID=A0A0D2GUU6_9EURO|nr:uncharacterized protein Z517_00156 [Fonsecaea pedrosoi CBS 271.37]KIW84768.1 hypothetical protein Z517_00156 [Fonsecaea pedrosoi CBS 271.37]